MSIPTFVLVASILTAAGDMRPIDCKECTFWTPKKCEEAIAQLQAAFQQKGNRVIAVCLDRGLRS